MIIAAAISGIVAVGTTVAGAVIKGNQAKKDREAEEKAKKRQRKHAQKEAEALQAAAEAQAAAQAAAQAEQTQTAWIIGGGVLLLGFGGMAVYVASANSKRK